MLWGCVALGLGLLGYGIFDSYVLGVGLGLALLAACVMEWIGEV